LQVLEAQTKLEELKKASENAWESLKEGVETSTDKLKDFASTDAW